jgi:hypothetical protein
MEDRKYVAERDRTVQDIDPTADYTIKNLRFGPLALTITNPARNQMQTLVVGARKTVTVPGARMTDMIFSMADKGMLSIVKS